MAFSFFRPLRRVIIKKFGGCKRFLIVLLCIVVIVCVVRSLFVVPEGRQVWDVGVRHNKLVNATVPNDCQIACPPDKFSFYIRTGNKANEGPVICFQGISYMSHEQKNVGRGMNVILVDIKTQTFKSSTVFDTYVDDSSLLRFLKKDAKDDDVILIATFDDASNGLKDSGRHWLSLFGSALVSKLGFRESWIFIGHKGLAKGQGIEYLKGKEKKGDNYAPRIEKAGCFAFPMGQKVNILNSIPDVLTEKEMEPGERVDNCGLPQPCPSGSVSVAVDTGHGNTRKPSICVDDYVRLGGSTHDAGRGFNIVSLDSETLRPKRLTHLDTYTFDSTDLEMYLESMDPNEIIIAVIADDGSKKLGQNARDMLNKMGSSHVQNLRFRDVWYFVGQKDIQGFSTLEQLSFAAFDGSWPKRLTAKFCVPKQIPTSQIMIEPEFKRNEGRRQFCTKYEGYSDFCNAVNVDEELKTIPIAVPALKNHKVFDTPVIIVPGMNHNAFVNTLQTTLMQPGIKMSNVMVFWDEKLPEYGQLADLFGFKNYSLDSSVSYQQQMIKALKMSSVFFANADHLIIIEEDLLLAPDFMQFMAYCMNVINIDNSLAGAFAWNINGFESVSGNSSLVYRVQEFPGLGFLMKSAVVENLINTWGRCCKNRAWTGWHLEVEGLEMLMPDVSRVYRTPFYGAEAESQVARDLFLKPRKTFLDTEPPNLDLKHLIITEYEEFLHSQIRNAFILKPSSLVDCAKGIAPPPDVSSYKEGPLAAFYHQNNTKDNELLIKLCHCFGLVALENYLPKNLHNGLLRFYYQKHDIFLVGTVTPYFDRLIPKQNVLSSSHLEKESPPRS